MKKLTKEEQHKALMERINSAKDMSFEDRANLLRDICDESVCFDCRKCPYSYQPNCQYILTFDLFREVLFADESST